MVSLSQILNPKLLLMPSASECSIHQETRSGGACMLVSLYKCMSRGFSCKHRLLPPPLNPLSAGDRKIRNDQTQNWFLISFHSPGGVGHHFYPFFYLTCSLPYTKIFLSLQKQVFWSCAWKTGDVNDQAQSSVEVCARVQLMQMNDYSWIFSGQKGDICVISRTKKKQNKKNMLIGSIDIQIRPPDN